MLVFIDESGDTGFKFKEGSSHYFIIVLVVFEDLDQANLCEQRIKQLKTELGKQQNWEFHFKTNSHKIKEKFLNAVMPYNFFYYGIVIDKQRMSGTAFENKDVFYQYACGLVFENAKEKLNDAIVLIDGSGNDGFKKDLSKYLKQKTNDYSKQVIKKVKMQSSHSNDLLQLADYVAGSINRSFLDKKFAKDYRKIIAPREISVEIIPKQ
jgi:hypothetical protein